MQIYRYSWPFLTRYIFSTDFYKSSHYQISRKSFRGRKSYAWGHTDGRMDLTKMIGEFHVSVEALNKSEGCVRKWKLRITDIISIIHNARNSITYSKIVYTGCNRRNGPDFGRVFLRSYYTDITQNTYIQSWMITEIMAREFWNFDS